GMKQIALLDIADFMKFVVSYLIVPRIDEANCRRRRPPHRIRLANIEKEIILDFVSAIPIIYVLSRAVYRNCSHIIRYFKSRYLNFMSIALVRTKTDPCSRTVTDKMRSPIAYSFADQ